MRMEMSQKEDFMIHVPASSVRFPFLESLSESK